MEDGLDISLEMAIESAQRGELARAEQMLQMLLERDPAAARIHNALGVVQLQMGKPDAAEASLLRCLQLAPDDARAHINLGKLYGDSDRPQAAEEHLRRAISLDAGSSVASFNLAMLLLQQGRAAEAREEFSRAAALDPQDAEAQLRLATLLLEDLQFEEAEHRLRDAIRLRPDLAEAHNNLALILLETGRLREAREACLEAVRISPGYLRAWSNFVMCGQYEPGATDDELLARAREAGRAVQAAASRFAASPATGRPRRSMGIVSGDLHRHPVGLLLLPVLRELHREGVKVLLYSNGRIDDAVTAELRRHAEWLNVAALPDEQVWSRIRSDAPDTLIDLAGHTGNNRLAVFAARAAPLQITWLGYFATTGTPNMDCVVMDPWHAPAGSERQFSERVLRLPHTRFCFQPVGDAPQVEAVPPVARRGTVTFGSFNNVAKINDQVVAAWSRVMRSLPGSRLVLKWRTLGDAECRERLAMRFLQSGIERDRVEMRAHSEHAAMLAQYAEVDIALDTFPFTGGQTSFEALWMGVPVISRWGERAVSRQTLCILGNLGLEELAADNENGFVERAVALARDVPRLRELRRSLRQRMMSSPLMQAPQFTRAFLTALRGAGSTV